MPYTLHDRERAFEAKFAHDEEFRFLVMARRDKLLAQWAALRLSLQGEEAESLAREVLAISGRPGHDEAVLKHVASAFATHGKTVSEAELKETLDRAARDSREQLGATLFD